MFFFTRSKGKGYFAESTELPPSLLVWPAAHRPVLGSAPPNPVLTAVGGFLTSGAQQQGLGGARGLVGGAGSQQAGPGAEIRAASDPSPSLGALRSLWVVPGRAVTQPVDSPSEELTASRLSLPTSLLSDSPGRCHCWWGSRGARLRAG